MTSEMHFEVGGKLLSVHRVEVRFGLPIRRHRTTGLVPECEESLWSAIGLLVGATRLPVLDRFHFFFVCWLHLNRWIHFVFGLKH